MQMIMGAIFFLLGVMLSYEVWFKFDRYFPRYRGDAIPVALILLCAGLMWVGMWFAATGLRVFT